MSVAGGGGTVWGLLLKGLEKKSRLKIVYLTPKMVYETEYYFTVGCRKCFVLFCLILRLKAVVKPWQQGAFCSVILQLTSSPPNIKHCQKDF